jgi:predicted deacylase
MREFQIFAGEKPGPTTVILAGVHGHEDAGVKAMNKFIKEIKAAKLHNGNFIECGRVILLIGNPEACTLKKRFVHKNLNRCFTEEILSREPDPNIYEEGQAHLIATCLDQADYLLDLHTCDEDTEPFVITEHNTRAMEIIANFSVEVQKVLFGINAFHPGSTDGYMAQKGKVGICLECGQNEDPKSMKIAKDTIYNFLFSVGHLVPHGPGLFTGFRTERFECVDVHKCAKNFVPQKSLDEFSSLSSGQLIGYDGDIKIRAPETKNETYVSLFVDLCKSRNEEAFLLARKVST